jgi:hypothetical protein
MAANTMFRTLISADIAEIIRSARKLVCYAAPGIQIEVAQAMLDFVSRVGSEMLTISLDFDERVMRMGYGAIEAVTMLREAGVLVQSSPGLRMALIIVDDAGFVFTPTPLYLESEPENGVAVNAMYMSGQQVAEVLARLSPAAKAIAVAQAKTPEEKRRIEALPVDVGSKTLEDADVATVATSLKNAPPVRFDLAQQVRVFEPYLQYVELSLTGAAIQRHRLAIPPSIQKLGGSKDLEDRLRTTFDLIERGSNLSSKPLEDALNQIRNDLTPSLGKKRGRVVLKAAKSHLVKRLNEFCERLEWHQVGVEAELQKHLDTSRSQIIDYYLPRALKSPPDGLIGQLLSAKPSEENARAWLEAELGGVFPTAESLIDEMKLEVRFKDVTFETLNQHNFLKSVKDAFPQVEWEKAYREFKAAGEKAGSTRRK